MTGARPAGWLLLAGLLAGCGPTLEEDYAAYSAQLQAVDYQREDRDPADAPFDAADLARNFISIALAKERMTRQDAAERPLRRWNTPVRYKVMGDSATGDDRIYVDAFMDRLRDLTGHEIVAADTEVNFPVFVLSQAERRRSVDTLREMSGGSGATLPGALASALTVEEEALSPCNGALWTARDSSIVFAAVLIRAETRDGLRRACIEEELSQSFGLTNDDPAVRPSIYNDDQEFALMTRHDDYLMRILYDPRLTPGMERDEVAPRLPEIIAGLGLPALSPEQAMRQARAGMHMAPPPAPAPPP